MRLSFLLAWCAAMVACPLQASTFEVEVQVPRLDVAEYHRPYVAIWLERPDNSVAADLAIWYDVKLKDKEGEKWLKDLRQWWRRSGRGLQLPVDGVSSATRAPGVQRLDFSAATAGLPAGEYRLMVEAVREVGGRELLTLPLSWPPKVPQESQAQGESELGRVLLRLAP